MAKKLSKRQRLKRDPANQRIPKLKAWAAGNGLTEIALSGLLRVPRFTPVDLDHPAVKRSYERQEKRWAKMEQRWEAYEATERAAELAARRPAARLARLLKRWAAFAATIGRIAVTALTRGLVRLR